MTAFSSATASPAPPPCGPSAAHALRRCSFSAPRQRVGRGLERRGSRCYLGVIPAGLYAVAVWPEIHPGRVEKIMNVVTVQIADRRVVYADPTGQSDGDKNEIRVVLGGLPRHTNADNAAVVDRVGVAMDDEVIPLREADCVLSGDFECCFHTHTIS